MNAVQDRQLAVAPFLFKPRVNHQNFPNQEIGQKYYGPKVDVESSFFILQNHLDLMNSPMDILVFFFGYVQDFHIGNLFTL